MFRRNFARISHQKGIGPSLGCRILSQDAWEVRIYRPPWSRVEGKSEVNLPQMLPPRGGICTGVDQRKLPFAPGLPPGHGPPVGCRNLCHAPREVRIVRYKICSPTFRQDVQLRFRSNLAGKGFQFKTAWTSCWLSDPLPCFAGGKNSSATLESSRGQILTQSPTDVTSSRWHLYGG